MLNTDVPHPQSVPHSPITRLKITLPVLPTCSSFVFFDSAFVSIQFSRLYICLIFHRCVCNTDLCNGDTVCEETYGCYDPPKGNCPSCPDHATCPPTQGPANGAAQGGRGSWSYLAVMVAFGVFLAVR